MMKALLFALPCLPLLPALIVRSLPPDRSALAGRLSAFMTTLAASIAAVLLGATALGHPAGALGGAAHALLLLDPVPSDLLIPAQTGTKLTSCFVEAGFAPVLRPEPEPASPQADAVELTARFFKLIAAFTSRSWSVPHSGHVH